jgi:hypothetical protein
VEIRHLALEIVLVEARANDEGVAFRRGSGSPGFASPCSGTASAEM